MNDTCLREPSSFRDPCGFIFYQEGLVFRQINKIYAHHYDHFISSQLYQNLADNGLILKHENVELLSQESDDAYLIIKQDKIPFINYPYEWSFSQLKDAALLTLQILKISLDHGMILKDASAFNIQFINEKPVFIDTLSFELYKEGVPWIAYQQFCEHFLGPLLLMHFCDVRLNRMTQLYLGSIPIDMVSKLLPSKTKFSFRPLVHIHLHARSQRRFADTSKKVKIPYVSKNGILGLINSLEKAVMKCNWEGLGTEWIDYYQDTNYSDRAFSFKKQKVHEYINQIKPGIIWDFGANTGEFSKIGCFNDAHVIAFDGDCGCVEKMYQEFKQDSIPITPLYMDLCNPSPSIGWNLEERKDIKSRGPVDMVLFLALIHHLRITGNIPFIQIFEFLSQISRYVIIEFIPISDSQVRKMIINSLSSFLDYSEETFESSMKDYFTIIAKEKIPDSTRTLYLIHNVKYL